MTGPAESPGWDWNRAALYLIVIALMVVSIGGQVQTLEATMGIVFALILAGAHDCAAMFALNALAAAPKKAPVKFWAWWVIIQAAFTGAALNTYHVLAKPGVDGKLPPLPVEAGLLAGIGPILLILPLSHIGSVAGAERRQRRAGGRTVGDEVADRQAAGDRQPTASPNRQGSTASTTGARPPASPAGDRQTARPTASRTATAPPALPADDRQGPLTMTTSAANGGALTITGGPAGSSARSPEPAAAAADRAARPTKRQDWMTDLLVHQVAKKVAAATPSKPYGRPQIAKEFDITGHKARTLLDYIAERDLAREAAS